MSTNEDFHSFKRYPRIKIGPHMGRPSGSGRVYHYCDDLDHNTIKEPKVREKGEIDLSISVPNHFTSRSQRYPEEIKDPYFLPELPNVPREQGRHPALDFNEKMMDAMGIVTPSKKGSHDPDLELFLRRMRRPVELEGSSMDTWMEQYSGNKNHEATRGVSTDGELDRFITEIRRPRDSVTGKDMDLWMDHFQNGKVKQAMTYHQPVRVLPDYKRPSRIRFYENADGNLRISGSHQS